ncbi:efflux RND transporter periplasmic adaptor subunit [Paenibacillus sp. YPG26]|uniref:efflux RND transporter periplasmic adaptor subunit n=1 Tax=Paenibacillus sp. YPG26 TaxID=2878915 RepID=UPI0020406539|nr:efflux RND transporter periplasmic adaptor subunit [Paenibacillus sp. YPG26]USB34530.1 efflux RND transporter periplasmic adaptor subunit [Paenibacillus sp. YPG26]
MSTKWWMDNLYRSRGGWRRGIGITALSVIVLASSGCGLLPKEQEEEVLPTIQAPKISKKPEYEVTSDTFETTVQSSGQFLSQREEPVYFTLGDSLQLHLKEINIKLGDKVKKGEVIATLDTEELQKSVRDKELDIRSQEITMKEALRTRDEKDPIEFETKKLQFEKARQELADLKDQISRAVLTAPFSGTVTSVSVEKGAMIKSYDTIAVIADTSNLIVAATIQKEDLEKLVVGMPAKVDINKVGEISGKIKVLPSASALEKSSENGGGSGGMGGSGSGGANGNGNGGTATPPKKQSLDHYMIVQLDKYPKGIERGTQLSVTVSTSKRENVIVIPISALRTTGSRSYVQVVEDDGSKREVDVEVGEQRSTDVEIKKGLSVGQKVVGR